MCRRCNPNSNSYGLDPFTGWYVRVPVASSNFVNARITLNTNARVFSTTKPIYAIFERAVPSL